MPILIQNRKAKFDYEILESYTAGMKLSGKMVKMVRNKEIKLEGKYIVYQKNQLMVLDLGNKNLKENVVLLLNKREKNKIRLNIKEKKLTCVPLQIKTIGRWLKIEIGIAKGRKKFEKKEYKKEKDLDRELGREIKSQR